MTAGQALPVRAVALEILEAVDGGLGNSSLLLERAEVEAGVDRALLTELTLGILRRQSSLDELLRQVSSRPLNSLDAAVRAALRIGIYQIVYLDRIPAYAAVAETVEAIKRRRGHREASFVNGVLRGFLRRREQLLLPGPEDLQSHLSVSLSLGDFLAGRWRERWGDLTALRLAQAALEPARVTLRVQLSRIGAEEAALRLAAEGVRTRPGRFLPEALVVEEGAFVNTPSFRMGLVMVEDEGAQLVARLVAPVAGERVLDACAAPGGKAIALADLARGRARIVAGELRPGRLRRVQENVTRTRPGGLRLLVMNALTPPFREASFGAILIDAPCSGTGTIRRNPELRWRVDAKTVERSGERASALLDALAPLVMPGGRLVYATCSLEPEENDHAIDRLLARDRGWERVDARDLLPAAAARLVGSDGVLRTHPEEPELDGFTAFVLRRRRG